MQTGKHFVFENRIYINLDTISEATISPGDTLVINYTNGSTSVYAMEEGNLGSAIWTALRQLSARTM